MILCVGAMGGVVVVAWCCKSKRIKNLYLKATNRYHSATINESPTMLSKLDQRVKNLEMKMSNLQTQNNDIVIDIEKLREFNLITITIAITANK